MRTASKRASARLRRAITPTAITLVSIARSARLWLLVGMTALLPNVVLGDGGPVDPDYLKASFVYRLAHFVSWPQGDASRTTIDFCILARPNMTEAMRRALHARSVGDRDPRITEVGAGDSLGHCEVLYVGADRVDSFQAQREAIEGSPVLVIGESDGFLSHGAMINLVAKDRQLRFEIDAEALRRVDLRPSSQLLRLALGAGEAGG